MHDEFSVLYETDRENLKKVEDWFDEVDEMVCTFKHRVHNWLREVHEAENDAKSHRSSSRASSRSQRSSRKSSTSRSSTSSTKERAVAERVSLTELMAEASFIEKRRAAEYEAAEDGAPG